MIVVTVHDSHVKALFREFPKIANAEVNRGYNRTVVAFMAEFTRTRLVKGIFDPRRKVRLKKPPKGQPVIAAKARKAGFVARLYGEQKLAGKHVRAYTGSPLLLVREHGGIIRPKKKDYLYIRGDEKRAFGRSAKGKARQARWEAWRSQQKWSRWKKPIVAKVKQVGPFPRLGFYSAWRQFQTKIAERMDGVVKQIVRRAELQLKRKAA